MAACSLIIGGLALGFSLPRVNPRLRGRGGLVRCQIDGDDGLMPRRDLDDDDGPVPRRDLDDAYLEQLEDQFRSATSGRAQRTVFRRGQRAASRATRNGALPQLLDLRSETVGAVNDYALTPGRMLLLGTLAMLLGFYFAHFIDCVFGQAGFWETVAGGVCLLLTENVTRTYYMTPADKRPPLLKLTNSFKVGLYYGLVLDAAKMAG